MDDIERLIEDWIQIRTTLKGHLKQLKDGGREPAPGQGDDRVTAETGERIHRCIAEIELLIVHYSSRI